MENSKGRENPSCQHKWRTRCYCSRRVPSEKCNGRLQSRDVKLGTCPSTPSCLYNTDFIQARTRIATGSELDIPKKNSCGQARRELGRKNSARRAGSSKNSVVGSSKTRTRLEAVQELGTKQCKSRVKYRSPDISPEGNRSERCESGACIGRPTLHPTAPTAPKILTDRILCATIKALKRHKIEEAEERT